MQTSVISVKTCEEIDRRIRNFVRGTTEEEHKIFHVAWEKVCLPKEVGGLGLKLSRQLNRVYLTKQDKLWTQILQHKYFKQTDVGLAL
ncbi:Putative ribonuclease H protein At1g65750 [Linum perenne]